jgi:hypothetical protein
MSLTTLPNVHVTNYQQYVNAVFLQQAIVDTIPVVMDAQLPENLYISIAYIDIKVISGANATFATKLVLNIKGKSYSYKLRHNNTDLYLAHVGLQTNQYSTTAAKGNHIKLLNQAFEAVVFMRAGAITDDLIANYTNK